MNLKLSTLIFFIVLLTVSSSMAQEVTIQSDGKVGIGTTQPIRNLEIGGDGARFLRINSTNAFPSILELTRNINGTGDNIDWRFVNNGDFYFESGTDDFVTLSTRLLTVSATNKYFGFGNGTVFNPLAKIEIENKSWQLRLWNSDPGGDDWWIGASSDTWNIGKKRFVISPSSSSLSAAFVIDSAKNIGIGTIDPKTKLHILGGSDASATIPNSGSLIVGNAATAHIAIDGNELMAKSKADSSGTLFIQNNGGFTRVGGEVGIGMTPPIGTELAINGNVALYNGVGYYGAIGPSADDLSINAGVGSILGGTSAKNLILQNTFLSLFPAGNVGIGTTDPVTKLQLLGSQDASYTTHGHFIIGDDQSTNIVFDNNEILGRNNGNPSTMYIQKDGGALLLCGNEAGQVGIGVGGASGLPEDLSYLLAVDGKIVSEEIRVEFSGNWPDYVFEKEYALMPIYDLEKSILRNKHLPNIPSANDIASNGQMVGEMQVKMLEKIEELTLYTIDQQKQIDAQSKQIELLIAQFKNDQAHK